MKRTSLRASWLLKSIFCLVILVLNFLLFTPASEAASNSYLSYQTSKPLVPQPKFLCVVRDNGFSRCLYLDKWMAQSPNPDRFRSGIEEVYDLAGLDPKHPTMLNCGGLWASSAFPPSQVFQRIRIPTLSRSELNLQNPPSIFLSDASDYNSNFASSCGKALATNSPSSPLYGKDNQSRGSYDTAVEGFVEKVSEAINETCSRNSSSWLYATGGTSTPSLPDFTGSANDLANTTKTALEIRKTLAEPHFKSIGTAVTNLPDRSVDGKIILGAKVTHVEGKTTDGKTAIYNRATYTEVDEEDGSTRRETIETCWANGRECTPEERDRLVQEANAAEAEAQAANEKDDGKAEAENQRTVEMQPQCDDAGCTDSCESIRAWWSRFVERCEQSGWQEYQCQRIVMKSLGCLDPAVVYPTPDGGLMCANPSLNEGAREVAARKACELKGGVMLCTQEQPCYCKIGDDQNLERPSFPDPCDDPRAMCHPDAIHRKPGSGSKPPSPRPISLQIMETSQMSTCMRTISQ